MGLGCGISMIKYILFVFNLICALCGIAILAVGVVFYIQLDDFEQVFDDWNVIAIPVLFMVLGGVIFIIAFFGCCGAIRQSRCMVITYSTLLMIILILQIVLGVIVFVYIGDIQTAAQKVLDRLWEQRGQNASFWDVIQKNLKCCGNTSILGWGIPPSSCCAEGTTICVPGVTWTTNCSTALHDFVAMSGNTMGIIALAVAGVNLIGFIFACCLASSISNQERRSAYN